MSMNSYDNSIYEDFASWLTLEGYSVTRKEYGSYSAWTATGLGIKGMFCTPSSSCYPQLSGRFVADNSECYNKVSQCPMIVEIRVGIDFGEIKDQLEFLGSKSGYEHSNSYAYLKNPCLRYDYERG